MACNITIPHLSDVGDRDSKKEKPVSVSAVTISKTHACQWCPAKFCRKDYLEQHLRVHTLERPFQCGICGRRFNQSAALGYHQMVHSGEKPFLCSVCPKTFALKHILKVHERTHGKEPFKCTECGRSFTRKQDFERHKANHCEEITFKCDLCPQAYAYPSSLRCHEKAKHNYQDQRGETLYKCDCGKCFARKWQLIAHRANLKGEKAFKCELCPLSYAYPEGLLRHKKKQHNFHDLEHTQKEEKAFKCANCGESFLQKWQLIAHEKKHEVVRAFKIDICPRTYAHSRGLWEQNNSITKSQVNEISHEEGLSFKCSKCGKSFVGKWEFAAHKAHYERVKRFKCDLCPRAYVYPASLRYHKKTKHK